LSGFGVQIKWEVITVSNNKMIRGLTDEQSEKLKELAKKEFMSMNGLLLKIITNYLNEGEKNDK